MSSSSVYEDIGEIIRNLIDALEDDKAAENASRSSKDKEESLDEKFDAKCKIINGQNSQTPSTKTLSSSEDSSSSSTLTTSSDESTDDESSKKRFQKKPPLQKAKKPSDESDSDHDDDDENAKAKPESAPKYVKTKDELTLDDLEPVEPIELVLEPTKKLVQIGKVISLVDKLVIIQSSRGLDDTKCPPLNEETILFDSNRKAISKIFEIFGPVTSPFYSLRFNNLEQINERGLDLKLDSPVFYAPDSKEYTKFIFNVHELRKQKGSDASWRDDNEPPVECLEYSDDEQEKLAKKQLKQKNKQQKQAGAKKLVDFSSSSDSSDSSDDETTRKPQASNAQPSNKRYQNNNNNNRNNQTKRPHNNPFYKPPQPSPNQPPAGYPFYAGQSGGYWAPPLMQMPTMPMHQMASGHPNYMAPYPMYPVNPQAPYYNPQMAFANPYQSMPPPNMAMMNPTSSQSNHQPPFNNNNNNNQIVDRRFMKNNNNDKNFVKKSF